jgi:hypothetical protein
MNDRPDRPDQRWANIAVVLIIVGAVFLLGELFNFRIGWLWPFFILVPGVLLLAIAFRRDNVNVGAAIPGALLTTLGLIFLYQQSTGHWESWAYIWALMPLSVGGALYLAGVRNDDPEATTNGLQMMRVFGIIFIAGLVLFELLIFDRGGFAGYFLPIALIIAGAGILWAYYQRHGTLPWNGFGPPPTSADGESSAPSGSPSSSAAPPPSSAATPPAATAPPPRAPAATQPPPTASSDEHFPEDELPETPPPDSAPFPEDEEAPHDAPAPAAPPAAAETESTPPPAAPKPRRRRTTRTTTTRKKTSTGSSKTNDETS